MKMCILWEEIKHCVTTVMYRNGCCCHPPGNTGEETAQMEHPQVHSSSK